MAESFLKLSGSTDGKPIKVTGTSTAATVTIHTAHATSLDIVALSVYNDDTVPRLVTIEWGGTTDPDFVLRATIPPRSGPVLMVDRLPLTNSLVIKAFCETANVTSVSGLVTRSA